MNWITEALPPKIRSFLKRETPENLWVKCPESGQLVFHKDIESNLFVVPGSGFHMRMPAQARLESLFDDGKWEELATPDVPLDPLKFRDVKRYTERLKEYRAKTERPDCVRLACGKLETLDVTVAVQDFDFIGGSLGMAAGEAIIGGMEAAVARRTPFIIFTASGGARMQEGMFSLMQMPRTTVTVRRLRAARLPYIVVLTNPTTGGDTASYARSRHGGYGGAAHANARNAGPLVLIAHQHAQGACRCGQCDGRHFDRERLRRYADDGLIKRVRRLHGALPCAASKEDRSFAWPH